MAIKIKRIYERPLASDGCRFLVDRLWPRGIAKSTARIDEWLKDLAPSDALRKWFGHKPEQWEEFQERYRNELQALEKQRLIRHVRSMARKGIVTFLYAAKDEEHNNARALARFVDGKQVCRVTVTATGPPLGGMNDSRSIPASSQKSCRELQLP